MKKIVLILSLALIFTMAIYGCKNDTENDSSETTATTTEVSTDENGFPANSRFNADVKETVYGEIKSIAGNMVTLELGNLPAEIQEKMKEGMNDRQQDRLQDKPDGSMTGDSDTSREEMEKKREELQGNENRPGTGNMSKEKMEEFRKNGGMKPEGMFEDLELEMTGETENYTIPVEMSIGTSDYSSLSKGMIISISLDENNNVVRVMVLKS